MALIDIFLGDRTDLRVAEKALREQEDRVFKLVDNEDHDLATHVRADIPRFEALNVRQRLSQARAERKANNIMFVTASGFLLVLAKLFGCVDLVLKALDQL